MSSATSGLPFKKIHCIDFEYSPRPGENPEVLCMVATELKTGQTVRQWADEFGKEPPFSTGKDSLFVAYNFVAEMSCFFQQGWKAPENLLDLMLEFRISVGGRPSRYALLDAQRHYGLPTIGTETKEEMQERAIRGGHFNAEERRAMLDYCESDVRALFQLLPAMAPTIDLPRALVRGQYMAAVAWMEHIGIPIDVPMLERLRENWPRIRNRFIEQVDASYQVYDGTVFKADRFREYLRRNGIRWPCHPTGQMKLDKETPAYPDASATSRW
jgi:hypothetical protein